MPFTPKTIHHGVHELDQRMTIEFGDKQPIQFPKRSLVGRMIVPWHTIIFTVAHFRGIALPLTFELYIGNFIEEKIRHTWMEKVGVLQHHSETDALVVAAS